jgi:hypothetical protein
MTGWADCPVLVVVGMPDEAEIAEVPGVEVLVGSGRVEELKKLLAKRDINQYRGVISFGVAGGLSPDIDEGDVVVTNTVIYKNEVLQGSPILVDAIRGALMPLVNEDLVSIKSGPLVSDDEWLGLEPGTTAMWHEKTGASATDHESFVAAEFALSGNKPFAAIRAISDAHDVQLPPAARLPLNNDGSPDLSAILKSILFHPTQLPDLIRLASRYGHALERLEILQQAIPYLHILEEELVNCN